MERKPHRQLLKSPPLSLYAVNLWTESAAIVHATIWRWMQGKKWKRKWGPELGEANLLEPASMFIFHPSWWRRFGRALSFKGDELRSFSGSWFYINIKKHTSFLILAHFPPLYETLCFSSCLCKAWSPPIGQLTHVWEKDRASTLNKFSHSKLAARHQLCKCLMCRHNVTSQSRRIKGGTSDEAFQVQCFLWERGASVDVDFDLFNSQHLFTCTRTSLTLWTERK